MKYFCENSGRSWLAGLYYKGRAGNRAGTANEKGYHMKITAAKQIVTEAFNTYNGFKSVLPANDLNTLAGNVKFNGWTQAQLFKFFDTCYTKQV